MNGYALLKRYHKEVDPQILGTYEDAPKSVWVNTDDQFHGKKTDKDLDPIEIILPEPPDPHLIGNFGLPKKDQYWRPPVYPKRLKDLESMFETIDEIWEYLEKNKDIYQDEIDFMQLQWERRLNGYWFYNNGVPTYIDGWHYFYCGWWHIDIGLPKYRDRDRRFFLFSRKIYTETIAPRVNEEGTAIRSKSGNYEWFDFRSRLFYGFNYPKHRREGATFKAECINYEIISRTINARGGIQSMTDDKAKKCFLIHLVAPWKRLPFFFKPNYEGSTSPKNELSFTPPAKRLSSKGSLSFTEIGLESGIDFGTADETAYEGTKLYFHHDDEVGRLKKGVNCYSRHEVVKECLVDGANIIGFTIKTSTVGEMEKGGGKVFKELCQMSNYYERTPNGQTTSGLAVLFMPAYDGLQGFIDQYGMSVIDTPTPEQAKFIGRDYGAREFLTNRRKGYLNIGDDMKLSGEIRLYPMRFAECFRTSQKASGFNMLKLETYIDNLSFKKLPIMKGNFVWKNNVKDSRVIFEESPNGKFLVSHQLNDNESNHKFWSDTEECWIPSNTHWGIAGGDPFKFNITKSTEYRKSKGGGIVVRKGQIRDGNITMKRRIVCSYENRTYDKHIYAEDMLMMCIYYGIKMFPEIDYPLLWDYFEERKYGGFLLYRFDPKTFRQETTPGATANRIKQQIFSEIMTWIENEADEEIHVEVLQDCRDIDGPEDMTNYDRFTAFGYALVGSHGIYDEIEEIKEEQYSLDNYFRKRIYKYSKIM